MWGGKLRAGALSPPWAHPSVCTDSLTDFPLPHNPRLHVLHSPTHTQSRSEGHIHRADGLQSNTVDELQRLGAGAAGPFPTVKVALPRLMKTSLLGPHPPPSVS